jgi:3-oxoacyl-[acyl-carrier-protein] synthase-3
MYETKIVSTGHFVPEKVLTNDDLSKLVETNDQWIFERTGIRERRVCDPEKGEFPSFMAINAAKEAIDKSGIDKNDIDLILFSITIPDYLFPNTATVLQEGLGITSGCACLDINAACTGWVYGLVMANSLIKTGVYKNILLIGCETTSRFNNWEDRASCILFGDGCGATLLTRADAGDKSHVLNSVLGCDSSKKEALILKAGGSRRPITKEIIDAKEQFVTMDGQKVFKAAVKTMSSHCEELLDRAKISKDQIKWFIPHQANQRIIEAVANRLEFPMEKVISNVHKYANTSSASIPIAFNESLMEGKIQRGDYILLAAFGAGLTSGAVLLQF